MQATSLTNLTTPQTEPTPRRWTRGEYYRMSDTGLFDQQRVELIKGEILKMSPQDASHYAAISLVHNVLMSTFGDGFWVRNQAPLSLGQSSEPEPDVAVVKGSIQDYSDHPQTALLIVEVSNTTLKFDRGDKASLYASAGIEEYWIVNLIDRQLEVNREPVADESKPFGFRYDSQQVLRKPDDGVSPLAASEGTVRLADILP